MRTLFFIALAGIATQLVDGALGMGFGVTSTTLMLFLAGLSPEQASAVVHAAELGATLASGASHWKFGNVDWKVALRLGIPGAIGAFCGAYLLGSISLDATKPLTSAILCCIGAQLIWRFSRGRIRCQPRRLSTLRWLPFLGLFGGFIDASGGGGWGPVTSSTLLSAGGGSPRRVVGTVNTAEFLVTTAATLGFADSLWSVLVENAWYILALLAGGVVAAPLGAWLTSRLNPTALGGFVGTTLLATNVSSFLPAAVPFVIVVGAGLSVLGWQRAKEASYSDPDADAARHRQRTRVVAQGEVPIP